MVVPIPVIVAVETAIALPEKLGLNSVQMQTEQIVDMQKFKMGWIPLEIPKAKSPVSIEEGTTPKHRRVTSSNKDPIRIWGLTCSQVDLYG
jgi:hypothetical protein